MKWNSQGRGCQSYISEDRRYRVFKSGSFWHVQDLQGNRDKYGLSKIIIYGDTFKEAKLLLDLRGEEG